MKALVKTKEVNEFQIEERQLKDLESDEVLIKVAYCGICGSDLHAANHAKGYEFVPKPIVLGHEFSGVVTKVGASRLDNWLNQEVIVHPGILCGECEQCQQGRENICQNIIGVGLHMDGGMVEAIVVKENQLIKSLRSLSLDIAALTEPMSVAIHAVNRVNSILKGKKVLVQGCGIIGMFTAIAAKELGAQVTLSGLEMDWEHRLSRASQFGLSTEIVETLETVQPEFDYLFECSGSAVATVGAVDRIKKGGSMILVALYEKDVPLPINVLVRKEINVLTSYAAVRSDFDKAMEVLEEYQEQFKSLIDIYPLDEGYLAFADARQQKVLKPIISPNKK